MEMREKLLSLLEFDGDYNFNEIYIWGTGNTSDLYQEGLKRLENEGIFIKGYFDNNISTDYLSRNYKKDLRDKL